MSEAVPARRPLTSSEREGLRRVDPGKRALVIAAAMLVLVVSALLPWVGDAAGWQVLTGQADPALEVGLLPHLFAINATIVGIGVSTLALVTRRWVLAFLAALPGGVVTFEGLIAIWSRQTHEAAGPGVGLLLAVACMLVLTVQWIRTAWSQS
ncbi:hypothetical protein IQ251_01435 [Saccharopolyspora sp. HNM0983]|uniref:Uncharacterized protein n=1 Tax=Saccharopolyspora montiporae TaxID=2781240 RepID=A0A929FW30_9PSEU|nr:hypothetical protein [Saccharopolyspora sp. HNM0983]MBE9373101.1 hypothetical protein [Saccharopolyspora sp. HNM0983]